MARRVSIEIQDFAKIMERDCFYIDKTHFKSTVNCRIYGGGGICGHGRDTDRNAVWSLLLSGGYVKVVNVDETELLRGDGAVRYELMLTSREVQVSFLSIVRGWFGGCVGDDYNGFVRALLSDDRKDSAKTPEAEGGR